MMLSFEVLTESRMYKPADLQFVGLVNATEVNHTLIELIDV